MQGSTCFWAVLSARRGPFPSVVPDIEVAQPMNAKSGTYPKKKVFYKHAFHAGTSVQGSS